ncbi:MAG: DM13 domain-containing protein [Thermoplasmata archaeon]|nr:MAG: DM13 domain-containing protein [Thermoplasmata archaeon]
MNKILIVAVIAIIVVISVIALWIFFDDDDLTELNDPSPLGTGNSTVILNGTFQSLDHHVEGSTLLIKSDDNYILRFEDFESDTGPDIFIYLSADLNAEDYIDLGKIKAYKGNINYDVPSDTDFEKYNKVLVWCEPFEVVFGYAELD